MPVNATMCGCPGDPLVLRPKRVWSRDEVLARDSPVPRAAGVYGWYFRDLPSGEIPIAECVTFEDLTLLYAGIAPRAPSAAGKPSGQTLRSRLRAHYAGNASSSTLRRSIGCLLGLTLQETGRTRRWTFGDSETQLDKWMQQNALVCWQSDPEPWLIESKLFAEIALPLNIDQNLRNPFRERLKEIRANCRGRPNAA